MKCITKLWKKKILLTCFIILSLFQTYCVSFNYAPDASNQDSATPIALLVKEEIQVVKAGETVIVPNVSGVKNWFLISDVALKKINNLRIEQEEIERITK